METKTTSLCNEIIFYSDAFLFSRGIDFLQASLKSGKYVTPKETQHNWAHKNMFEIYNSVYFRKHSTHYN